MTQLVLFLGACLKPGNFMIVTELVESGDLASCLVKNRNLSLFLR